MTGRNPLIERTRSDYRKYIPEPYRGVVLISADFELAWAWRYAFINSGTGLEYAAIAKRERHNIPGLLVQCEKYHIPVTWGTIGHLFLGKCKRGGNIKHEEIKRLPWFKNKYWQFSEGDWFDHDPASDYISSPEWYAPDLVELIIKSNTGHEIACHTFSHISCDEGVCSPEVIDSELKASQEAADAFELRLESFIFPGHTMGNFDTIRRNGYRSIRTNLTNTLGYPVLRNNGLWEHKATMEIRFNNLFSEKENLRRYYKMIEMCISNHQVCHFWLHPSFDEASMEVILISIFEYLHKQGDKVWITTMRDYTTWLDSNK